MIYKLYVVFDVLINHIIEFIFINLEINNKFENLEVFIVLFVFVIIFAVFFIFVIIKFGSVVSVKVGINDNVFSKFNLFV